MTYYPDGQDLTSYWLSLVKLGITEGAKEPGKPSQGLAQAVNLDDFLGIKKRMIKGPLGQKLSENSMISQAGFKNKILVSFEWPSHKWWKVDIEHSNLETKGIKLQNLLQ